MNKYNIDLIITYILHHMIILWFCLPTTYFVSRVEAISSRGLKYSRTWRERPLAVGIEGLEESGHTCSWGTKERIWRVWQEDGNSNMPKLPCCCCLGHGSCWKLQVNCWSCCTDQDSLKLLLMTCWAQGLAFGSGASSNSFSVFFCSDNTFCLTAKNKMLANIRQLKWQESICTSLKY